MPDRSYCPSLRLVSYRYELGLTILHPGRTTPPDTPPKSIVHLFAELGKFIRLLRPRIIKEFYFELKSKSRLVYILHSKNTLLDTLEIGVKNRCDLICTDGDSSK